MEFILKAIYKTKNKDEKVKSYTLGGNRSAPIWPGLSTARMS